MNAADRRTGTPMHQGPHEGGSRQEGPLDPVPESHAGSASGALTCTSPERALLREVSEEVAAGRRDTSVAAAASVRHRAADQRRVVLEAIWAKANVIDESLPSLTGIVINSARPRRVELAAWGYVHDSGRRATTSSGRAAIVWTPTSKGIATIRTGGPIVKPDEPA